MYVASLKNSENYKAHPYQYASPSKQILNTKAKPFPPCTHCSFNDHRPDDFCMYHKCEICGSNDHATSGHNHVILVRGGALAKSSQASKSSVGISFNTYGSIVHSTTDHNDFEHFNRGVAERKNIILIKAARTMLNGSVLSKHFWIKAFRISCYTQNRSIIVKRYDKTPYEICRERIPGISYFHVFGCPMFIYNHKDHLGKFDAKADDGYFLGYSFVSKSFRFFNTRRQHVEKTYHVTFDESMEAIRFTNTSVAEIGIDDSPRYLPDEFIHEDNPSRQYQANSDISYYITPHNRSLIEHTQTTNVLEVIIQNEQTNPLTEDAKDAMKEELNQFYRNKVWTLVPLPKAKIAIGSK
ncbi:retrovirus-related pol polyprotein from transposon TNT 1-94 [Tanacetum coccineum]